MDLHLGSAHSRIAWDPQKKALPQETDRARKLLVINNYANLRYVQDLINQAPFGIIRI